MKKGVVTAVAAGNMTIFSGLVNAEWASVTAATNHCGTGTTRSSQKCCEIVKNGKTYKIYECKKVGTSTVIGWCAQDGVGSGNDFTTGTKPSQC